MTGGVLMSKNNLLLGFILGLMGTFFLLSAGKAQDRIPACPPLGKTLKMIKPLREMNWANDTIAVQTSFPSAFRETGRNEIIDSIALLTPVFERLRQVRAGLSEDTVRILHIGDSHVRGHIYPQTTGTLLKETFGAVSYTDMGVNGATCLTFTHPGRIADIAAMKPELLILSFGTNESLTGGITSTCIIIRWTNLSNCCATAFPMSLFFSPRLRVLTKVSGKGGGNVRTPSIPGRLQRQKQFAVMPKIIVCSCGICTM